MSTYFIILGLEFSYAVTMLGINFASFSSFTTKKQFHEQQGNQSDGEYEAFTHNKTSIDCDEIHEICKSTNILISEEFDTQQLNGIHGF